MNEQMLARQIEKYMKKLCVELPHRHVGSSENRIASAYFHDTIASYGFDTQQQEFDCIDWKFGDVKLTVGDEQFVANAGPYSLPLDASAEMIVISTIHELEQAEIGGKIVLFLGDIASEQIMPKSFVFYNPEHHQKIIAILEEKKPVGVIAATGKNPELAGSWYPFPMFEDGDFDIPNVFIKDVDGERLRIHNMKKIYLAFTSHRIPAKGYNIIARKGDFSQGKILITAHIDSKITSPGALDNGTGVAVLLGLAELLQNYNGTPGIEIVPFNGEDYFSAPGQMSYLASCNNNFEDIRFVINLHAAGYKNGNTAYSLYNQDAVMTDLINRTFSTDNEFLEGESWVQGDHSMFTMQGCPAIAITSEKSRWLCSEITHTEMDNITQVDITKLARTTLKLHELVEEYSRKQKEPFEKYRKH
ncbi:MAG: M28 family peptidase [Candidatus Electryonea clarkiae]|nr:M28 family peptidase [Candidatus Electryonea clarkiae]MDP8288189.1 M28 family peptidase [Candidatus Electryonea clarkiae]